MPTTGAGSPRVLLRRLREIMADGSSAQTRLDKLVALIASNMVAEVCSIYLRRAGNALELFATQGLNPGAVHNTRLRSGQGLVGLVAESAEPVNLTNAPDHPRFAYRPETGEDPYKSFLGVPIVRGGQVYGVLTVQNRAARQYDEEEVEALQTVAMVLAEVVASGGLFDIAELDEPELRSDKPRMFAGDGHGFLGKAGDLARREGERHVDEPGPVVWGGGDAVEREQRRAESHRADLRRLHLLADHQGGEFPAVGRARLAFADQLAGAQHQHAVADRHDLLQLVRDEDDRQALGDEQLQRAEQGLRFGGRQHRRRFVEDQDPGIAVKRLQDLHPLALADRKGGDGGGGIDGEAEVGG